VDALDLVEARTWTRFAPPPRLTLSAWADAERVLPAESSAEPGRWRTSRVPYLKAPMDAIADRHIETVVIMASSQVGKTEVLLNLIGYQLHLDPAPMLLIEPTLEMAGAISKDRIAPMLRDTPALAGRVSAAKTRDGSNTTLHKSFPGGSLTLAGANSPASLASRPIRVLLGDELDRWPSSIGTEGDPLTLAVKRTTTFRRRKIVLVSSPTVKGASRIEDWWNISDQRRLHVPCPRCGCTFVLAWEQVRWTEGDPDTAFLQCPHCSGRIDDHERPRMVAAGEWVASAPASSVAGFHIWEMYSPWRSLREQVAGFLIAKRSLEMRQAWTNTALGQVWEAPGERVEPAALLLRREDYGGLVPAGVRLITCGIDTQDDRLEFLIVGWGPGEEAWILERDPLPGDPSRPEVWTALDEVLATEWPHAAGGTMRIQCALVDAGGHRTQAVYNAVIPRQPRRLFASFGRSGGEKGQLVSPAKAIRPANGTGNVMRRIVDVDQAKALIFSRLRLAEHGAEYVHLPTTVGETFVDELTAEQLMTKRNKYGVPTKTWERVRERNESLDCFVLSLAALRIIAPNSVRFDTLAAKIEESRSRITPTPAAGAQPAPPPKQSAGWIQPRRGGWLRGGR
jgi:phage terminase large subunit GpA-like protein